MKIRFNEKAAQKLAGNVEVMSHTLFLSISGLAVWHDTVIGLVGGFLVWFILQCFAFLLRSLSSEEVEPSG